MSVRAKATDARTYASGTNVVLASGPHSYANGFKGIDQYS